MAASVLIVEDEKNTREGLTLALEEEYDVYAASNADQAFELMKNERFDVILTDLRMAGKSGLSVIDYAVKLPNQPICIMMTAYGNVETAVEAMKRGAFDFLTKPVNLEKLEIIIRRGLQSKQLKQENQQLHARLDERYQFKNIIIGNAPSIQNALKQIEQVAPSKATVLITGETGTGKELFAQMVHQNSPRARNPFIAIHCAALPANLLESELFGHEKGAFTGASEKRIGRFEAAHSGTVFLDEIGEIDHATQVKLLRFLETRSFERIGSSKTITVDVRLVCATNRDLQEMVKEGKFREDLYYRLNVVSVQLPPLRERTEDIPALIDYYVNQLSKDNAVRSPSFTNAALEVLKNYTWPGNIRELRNFCENIVVMHPGELVDKEDLNSKYSKKEETKKTSNEKALIADALTQTKGNKTEAAKILGISRRTLHRKLDQWPDLNY